MPNTDEIVLQLGGEVTLEALSKALASMHQLASIFRNEVARGVRVKWVIEDLQPGSATVVFRGRVVGKRQDGYAVSRITHRWMEAATAYQHGHAGAVQSREKAQFDKLAALVNGAVKDVRFHTLESDAVITAPMQRAVENQPLHEIPEARRAQRGAVVGYVTTLSSQSGLRFVMRDKRTGRGIICYFASSMKEEARNVWDGLVRVEGFVRRDSGTGEALIVTQVDAIHPIAPTPGGAFRRARGAISHLPSAMSSEEAIRRVRDGEED